MWLPMLMIVACLAMLRLLPGRGPRRTPRATPGVTPMRAVLRDRPLLLCIAAASLVQASNGFLYSIRRCTGRPRACPPR